MKRDREFLIELATMYYEKGYSQQELARHYSLSRPSVSGLLKQCRAEGIVEIRIASSSSSLASALEERLRTRFGLRHCAVTPRTSSDSDLPEAVGKRSAEMIESLLKDNLTVGLSWGRSLFHSVEHLQPALFADILAVQMVGGLGAHNVESDGYALVRRFAARVNSSVRVIQAPIIVGSDELKDMLIREPAIQETIGVLSRLDLAIVGISSNRPENSSLVREGFIRADESQEIWDAGGVGHICGYHFDADGRFMDIPINRRIVGIESSGFADIPDVLAVAWGRDKVAPLLGALKGRIISSLVTDEDTAMRLLSGD